MLKTEYIKDFAKKTNISQVKAKKLLNTVYFHLLECIQEDEIFTPIGKFKKVEKRTGKKTLEFNVSLGKKVNIDG